MKRWTAFFLAVLLFVSGISCTKSGTAETVSGGRKWTDSLGRELELPERIGKAAVTGTMSQMVLFALAPEMLCGLSEPWAESTREYIPEEYLSLPALGQLYGGKGAMNPEELLRSSPDIVIDIGEPKAGTAEDLDALTAQTGIPFVHITMTLESAGDAFRKLGELLGLPERAEEYASYCESVYVRAEKIMEKVKEEDRAHLVYVSGRNSLSVIPRGGYHAELIDFFSDNAAELSGNAVKGTGTEADLEQLLLWDPDWIIFAGGELYEEAAVSPRWKDLRAVQNGRIFECPSGPYHWMGTPPSVQRFLGMLWLPALLYPEETGYDLREEVMKYYQMFYHKELTEEQYRKLTGKALP